MIGRGKNMKDMIITHAKDVDGVSPVILLQLIKRKVDFYLLEIEEVEEKVPALLKEDYMSGLTNNHGKKNSIFLIITLVNNMLHSILLLLWM